MSALLTANREPSSVVVCDDGDRYEVIDGVRVEMPPMSADASEITSELARHLGNFAVGAGRGRCLAETLVKLPLPVDRQRRPDAIYVPYSRWAKGRGVPRVNAWEILPELCVEVVSPTDLADEVWDKVLEYFRAGVSSVWVVHPRQQTVHAYDSPKQVRVLDRSDTLGGGTFLPGFGLPLAELFPDQAAQM